MKKKPMSSYKESLTPVQKVAIFLVTLGEDSVKALAPFFPKEMLQEISAEIDRMNEIDPENISRVVEEFYHQLLKEDYSRDQVSLSHTDFSYSEPFQTILK